MFSAKVGAIVHAEENSMSQSFGQVPRAHSTPATARADTITAIMVLIIIFKILNSSVKISSRYGA